MIDRSIARPATCSRMRGVGLIEVLVAMFILAIGVLGAAALQLNALKYNQTAGARSQATFLAYEIVDRMRANRAQAKAGSYNVAKTTTPACPGTTLAQIDLCDWRTALKDRLPEGVGAVERSGTSQFMITIQWDERRNSSASTADIKEFVFITDL